MGTTFLGQRVGRRNRVGGKRRPQGPCLLPSSDSKSNTLLQAFIPLSQQPSFPLDSASSDRSVYLAQGINLGDTGAFYYLKCKSPLSLCLLQGSSWDCCTRLTHSECQIYLEKGWWWWFACMLIMFIC